MEAKKSVSKKIEVIIRKGKSKKLAFVVNPMQAKIAKTDKSVLVIARNALAEKLKAKGQHRVEIRRGGEKCGEWTVVPRLAKKKKAA